MSFKENLSSPVEMSVHRMFVYGTLKNSQPNNEVIKNTTNGAAQFLGKGITKSLYPLVVASRFNVPFLLPFEGKGKNVHGEIYDVDDKMLKFLDDFEGHPTLYERQQIPILFEDKSKLCWCYIVQKIKPELLELPFIEDYDANNSEILKYEPRYKQQVGLLDLRTDVQLE